MPSPLAFTRHHRLLTGTDFQAVFDQPTFKVSQSAFLILCRETQSDRPRLGLVVGAKKARRAVDRGRIKRRAREQFRQRQHELAGLDIIVLLRGKQVNPNRQQVTRELSSLFDKLLAKRLQA